MRSRAALSGVSRSEYLLFSIVLLVRYFVFAVYMPCCALPIGTHPHIIFNLDKTEIPCCFVHNTDLICYLFAPLKRSPQIVEEHDSITSLIAAVESGRGVAVIAQPLNGLGSPRLKIRPVQPAPSPLVVGIAYRKKFRSAATDNFIAAAKRA